jgi:hypothetical protein
MKLILCIVAVAATGLMLAAEGRAGEMQAGGGGASSPSGSTNISGSASSRQPANPGSAVLLQNGFIQTEGGSYKREQISLGDAKRLFGIEIDDFRQPVNSPLVPSAKRMNYFVRLPEGHIAIDVPAGIRLTNSAALVSVAVLTNTLPTPFPASTKPWPKPDAPSTNAPRK